MKIYVLLLLFSFTFFKAQKISFVGTRTPFPYSAEVLDQSFQNFYYNFKFVKDTKNSAKNKETICVLRVGKKYTLFSDYYGVKADSISEKLSHKSEITAKEFNEYFTYPFQWYNDLVKNLSQKKVIIQDLAKNTYQYEENQPNFDWTIEKDTKEILGHQCQKATTKYRGRKYTAWYAKDIPINNGPYIFEGLPGLILEIEDTKNHYHFTAIATDKKPSDIYIRNEKQILHISREQFRKVQKNYHENPGFYNESVYDATGNPINNIWKPKPYNPIELE